MEAAHVLGSEYDHVEPDAVKGTCNRQTSSLRCVTVTASSSSYNGSRSEVHARAARRRIDAPVHVAAVAEPELAHAPRERRLHRRRAGRGSRHVEGGAGGRRQLGTGAGWVAGQGPPGPPGGGNVAHTTSSTADSLGPDWVTTDIAVTITPATDRESTRLNASHW